MSTVAETKHEDHITAIARRMLGITSPTWGIFQYEAIDRTGTNRGLGFMVTGSETGVFKSGPRKGKRRFIGARSQCVILPFMQREQEARFEAETGECHACMGEGKVPHGWGPDGTHYRPCPRCNATGKKP